MADTHVSMKYSIVNMIANRVKNPYGFHIKHCTFHQFATLIGLDEESTEFQNMKNNFNDLRKQFLSIDYSSMKQSSSFRLIENELKRRYPHLFEGKNGQKHLYFALHVLMEDHVNERKLHNNRKDANVPKNNQNTAASRNMQRKQPIETDETIDLTDDQNINTIIRNIKPIVSRPALRAIQNFDDVEKAPTSSPAPRRRSPLQYTSGTSSMQGSASGSSQPKRAIAILNPLQEPERDVPTALRQTEIYKFLSTCQPPMTHHLRRFVDFGCTTRPYLRSVSRWPGEQRYKLLKRILESVDRDAGALPSEMDIAILEHQFDTYFMED